MATDPEHAANPKQASIKIVPKNHARGREGANCGMPTRDATALTENRSRTKETSIRKLVAVADGNHGAWRSVATPLPPIVTRETVTLTGDPLGVTLAGDTLQVDCAGAPVQVIVTA